MSFFYLSFCDTARPEGQQFLGATVVRGEDPDDALAQATQLGINPGGEVAFVEFDPDIIEVEQFPAEGRKYFERFIPRDEVLIGSADKMEDDATTAVICQDCNPRVSR